jgi:ATP-binding cassette subfamily F protein uup
VVTQTIASEGDGIWKEYAGGYSDWRRAVARGAVPAAILGAKEVKMEPGRRPPQRAPDMAKLNFRESRELAELPGRIDALEREQGEISSRLADGALYREQPATARELQRRVAAIEEDLMQALERWEALGAKK